MRFRASRGCGSFIRIASLSARSGAYPFRSSFLGNMNAFIAQCNETKTNNLAETYITVFYLSVLFAKQYITTVLHYYYYHHH